MTTTPEDEWGAWEGPEPAADYDFDPEYDELPSRAIPKAQITGAFVKGATTWGEVWGRAKRRVRHEVRSLPWTAIRFLITLPYFLWHHVARPIRIGWLVSITKWWQWVTCNENGIGLSGVVRQAFDKGRAPSAEEIAEGRKPTQTPTEKQVQLYRHRRARWLLTLAGLVLVLNAPWVLDTLPWTAPIPPDLLGWTGWGWSWQDLWSCYLYTALLVFEEIGRRYEPPEAEDAPARRVLLHPNIPIGQLRSGIESIFQAWGYPLKLTDTDLTKHLFRFGYYCPQEITENMLRQLERGIGARPKSISRAVNPDDASTGQLSIMVTDPLAEFVPSPEYDPPRSRDVCRPLDLGPCEDGTTTGVTFAHAPVIIIAGQTGSGKSGITNNVVERLSDTYNGHEIWCVDPTDGPDSNVLAGFYTEFDGRKVQVDERDAEALIDWAIADCQARNRAVNAKIAAVRPDPETGKVPRGIPRNHAPTADDPQRWIVIEEYPQVKEWKSFVNKVELLARKARKGAWGLIIVTQSTTKANGMGSTVLQNQATIRLIASTKPGELQYAIGQGAAEQGFHPETLVPATKVKTNDAGKFYALSSDRWDPVLTRSYGLEFEDIIERIWRRTGVWDDSVLERLESAGDYADDRDGDGIPDEYDDDPDDPNVVRMAQWMYEHRTTPTELPPSDGDAEPTPPERSDETPSRPDSSRAPTGSGVPPLLQVVLDVANKSGYTRIPTRWILAQLQSTPGPWKDWDANQLGNAMRQLGMPRSAQLGKGTWGNSAKGYRKADVEAVIRGEKLD